MALTLHPPSRIIHGFASASYDARDRGDQQRYCDPVNEGMDERGLLPFTTDLLEGRSDFIVDWGVLAHQQSPVTGLVPIT
jgi:hypothetical protein